jgi:hypothetical protein
VVTGPFAELVRGQADFPHALFTTREADDRPAFLTFDGLIADTDFVADVRAVLAALHAAYAHPVEIEFALNFTATGDYRINLLQCRPMQVRSVEGVPGEAPPAALARVVEARGAVIGPSRVIRPDRLIYVRPGAYAALSASQRIDVARVLGRLNALAGEHCLLVMGPGRWGSSDAFLGVPVRFSEINHVAALCEIVAMHEHLVPDVSLGTHFLNELIEADVLYFALFPKLAGNSLDEAWILRWPNRLAELLPGDAAWADVLHVADPVGEALTLYADAPGQRLSVCLQSARA